MTTQCNRAAAYRRGLIASVHIAAGDMGLDEKTYRKMLESIVGHNSAAKCSIPQLKAVLAEMRRNKGWQPRPRAGQPTAIPAALLPLHAKVAALCKSIERPLAYADEIIKRQTKNSATLGTADRTQLTACVAALVRQQGREGE
ncbi:phage protein GemA/Gp16 family protein [Desulfovibrio falkowii]|uniref:Regulatory protein GemA n=1 Tax=Desulfovibrio falkowii TaxID=3136602 RepID=A0ABQ0EAE5_9BACT